MTSWMKEKLCAAKTFSDIKEKCKGKLSCAGQGIFNFLILGQRKSLNCLATATKLLKVASGEFIVPFDNCRYCTPNWSSKQIFSTASRGARKREYTDRKGGMMAEETLPVGRWVLWPAEALVKTKARKAEKGRSGCDKGEMAQEKPKHKATTTAEGLLKGPAGENEWKHLWPAKLLEKGKLINQSLTQDRAKFRNPAQIEQKICGSVLRAQKPHNKLALTTQTGLGIYLRKCAFPLGYLGSLRLVP